MTEYTPTPWTLTPEPHASWIGKIGNNHNDPQLWSVATPFPKGDKQADAALIVKAVNSHNALVMALETAENSFDLIRQILIGNLTEPERSAFWKAVEARDALRTALVIVKGAE